MLVLAVLPVFKLFSWVLLHFAFIVFNHILCISLPDNVCIISLCTVLYRQLITSVNEVAIVEEDVHPRFAQSHKRGIHIKYLFNCWNSVHILMWKWYMYQLKLSMYSWQFCVNTSLLLPCDLSVTVIWWLVIKPKWLFMFSYVCFTWS